MKNSQEVEFINQDCRENTLKHLNRHGCFLTQNFLINMNQLRMSRGSTGKISTSLGETETIVWNRFLYQVPEMVGTNASADENRKFYNSTVQAISRVGDCATKVGAMCAHFFDMWAPVKTQVENGLRKL